MEGRMAGGEGGQLLPTADFIFFPFSHFNKGLPSFTRPLGFTPAVLLLLLLLPSGRRAPHRVSGKITLFVRVMSNFTQTVKGRNTERSLTQSVTLWKSQSKKLSEGSTKKKKKQRRVKRLTLLLAKSKLIPSGSAAVRRVAD